MLPILTPQEARDRMAKGAVLIDIRAADEHARARIPGAHNVPLDQLGQLGQAGRLDDAPEVIFHCKSGMRTAANAARLAEATAAPAALLAGGIDGWEKAGFACERARVAPIEIIRQVQIGAGLLVLAGVLLGALVTPWGFALSGFIGAGLIMAGATGWCGMAKVLALMPWNARARAS